MLLLLIENGVVPGGSGTTMHKKNTKYRHKTIHNTQNYRHNKGHVLDTLNIQNGNFNLTKNLSKRISINKNLALSLLYSNELEQYNNTESTEHTKK